MSDLDKNTETPEPIQPVRAPQLALDDQRRIKVLSPGMLVAKRFFPGETTEMAKCLSIGGK